MSKKESKVSRKKKGGKGNDERQCKAKNKKKIKGSIRTITMRQEMTLQLRLLRKRFMRSMTVLPGTIEPMALFSQYSLDVIRYQMVLQLLCCLEYSSTHHPVIVVTAAGLVEVAFADMLLVSENVSFETGDGKEVVAG